MSQYVFGTGNLWGTATQDAAGNTIAVPVPVKFGELQDVGLDIGRDIKMLYGQNNLPMAIGGGKMKYDFKAKFARISGRVFNDLFFGQVLTSAFTGVFNDLTGTAIPASPFTITVTPPNAGTYARDLGVVDANGIPMTRVASAPATGQYSLAGAVYTFATADTGKTVYISYSYTATAGTQKTISLNSQLMGTTPVFGVDLALTFGGKQMNWRFPNCVSSKLSLDPKQDDFSQVSFDFSAFADATGNIGTLITGE
ncbi:MAG: hypothetical protein AB9M53_00420 [Leptothrix sp. (in: b-proteobacteria)]